MRDGSVWWRLNLGFGSGSYIATFEQVLFDRILERNHIEKIAFIYPGQGSQYVGMAKDLYDGFNEIKEIYQTANEILGFDLAKICFEGPAEELKQTRVTQPAIFVHSAALTHFLFQKNIQPAMSAGHSLGEYSALYSANVLSFEDALRLVKTRAELMQQAGEIKPGRMAAVLGLETDVLHSVCQEAGSAGVVQVANLNSPGQIVISGSVTGVEKAMEIAKEKGARRVIPLVVSGAFHSPLMEYAEEGLQKALGKVEIKNAEIPVYANVSAEPITAARDIKHYLLQQLTSPVRWMEIIENMIKAGGAKFYEVGPGAVLKGLLRRINREAVGISIDKLADLESLEA